MWDMAQEQPMDAVARLHVIGVPALFEFTGQPDLHDATKAIATIVQGGLGLPDRDYYLNQNDNAKQTRTRYLAHVAKVFTLIDDDPATSELSDGQVAITDLQKHQSRAIYDHIDLDVNDFAPDQEFSIKAEAHLPGQGKQEIVLDGKGGPIKQTDLLNTNFNGNLRLDQVSVGAVQKFLNSES